MLLIEPLPRDGALTGFFSAQAVKHASIGIDSDELVAQFSVAGFAHAVISDHNVRRFQLIAFLLTIDSFHFGHSRADLRVLLNSQFVVKHVTEVLQQIVILRADVPVVRDDVKNLFRFKLVTL